MDVEYSLGYKENNMLLTLVLPTILAVETDSLQRHCSQAYEISLQTTHIMTELETLWNFIHVHCVHVSNFTSETNI